MFRMNEGFDAILVTPTPQALSTTLAKAVKAANFRCRKAKVEVPPEDVEDLGRAVVAAPEGHRQWMGDPGAVPRSVVGVAWWADRLGRPHVRVAGTSWSFAYGPSGASNIFCPHPEPRPPLWMIYPDFTYLARIGGSELVLVACPCGEAGTPAEIGWMGDCCTACHDRREDGQAVPALVPLPTPPRRSSTSLGDPMSFAPDGTKLARITHDGIVVVHDLETGAAVQWSLQEEERGSIVSQNDLEFLPDSRTVVLTARSHLLLLDTVTGDRRPGPHLPRHMERLALSPDGRLAVVGSGRECLLYDMVTGEQRFAIPGDAGGPEPVCVAFAPDGRHLALGCLGGVARVWDAVSGCEAASWTWPGAPPSCIAELAVSADGRLLATLASEMADNLVVRDLRTGAVQGTWTLGRKGYHPRYALGLIAFSPDSRTLAASEEKGTIKLFDVAGGPPVTLASMPGQDVMALAFQPSGCWLATTGGSDWIKFWPCADLLAAARRQVP
jgi:hypothetical protein